MGRWLRRRFERQLRREEDGTWLARPYGRLGGVYALDREMREDFLRVRSRAAAVGLIAVVAAALLVVPFVGWFPYLLAALVALANLHYFFVWRALRKARQVASERWAESREGEPAAGVLPRSVCRVLAAASGLLAALGLVAISTEGPSPVMLGGIVLLGGLSCFYWRLGQRTGER